MTCRKGHDNWYVRPSTSGQGKRYCGTCHRDRQRERYYAQREAHPPVTRYKKWDTVRDSLEYWSALYELPRAIREASRQLGMTVEAVKRHVWRNQWAG